MTGLDRFGSGLHWRRGYRGLRGLYRGRNRRGGRLYRLGGKLAVRTPCRAFGLFDRRSDFAGFTGVQKIEFH
jgi:hypothetical protein